MRELTSAETEHAAGGVGFTTGIAIGIGTSLVGTYLYEKAGGAAGIEKMARAVWDALVEGAIARAETCQKVPGACVPAGF